MDTPDRLCAVTDIPDGGAKGFGNGTANDLFAVRQGGQVAVYRNRCPHAGTPLNWMPDRFLTADGENIICATHGAIFEVLSGHCIQGPCAGQYLVKVPVEVRDDVVWLR